MKNEILKTTEAEFEGIKSRIDIDKTFLAEIDGSAISDEISFFDYMERLYDLHTLNGTWGRNWSALNDLMTDLDWLDYDKHIIAIHSYDLMFSDEPEAKTILMKYLKDSILPFWEEDVLNIVVGGKRKEFTVYLIC
ncbi:MAG: barstar family protein [Ruminococcus sp.]